MGVEIRPLGVRCNIQCQYCYQNPQRDAGNQTNRYDLTRIKAAIEEENQPFTLFGGEPLMVRLRDLENLWALGLERFGGNRIQTNGVLVDDDHIRLFKKYKVHVGISVDGPHELNDARWAGSLEKTRAATAKTERAIRRLCREGLAPTLIVTLHRGNGTPQKLGRMQQWFLDLEGWGVTKARLHILEVESGPVREKYALSSQENLDLLLSLYQLEKERLTTLRFDLFDEMRKLLTGREDAASCVWRACDPFTTAAVQGIEGDGQRSNCGRTNKDGIDFVKADREGFERYLALYQTPQEYQGCQDCRFFLMCKGQCPGTAVEGDWRNRSEYCQVWKQLFEVLERELVQDNIGPLSLDPQRARLEETALRQWALGNNLTVSQLFDCLEVPAESDA